MEYKKIKLFLLQKFVNKKYIDYMNKKIDNKNKEIEKLIEALFWCSGSQDFAPGGIARNGWVKLCQPLLQKYLEENKDNIVKQKDKAIEDVIEYLKRQLEDLENQKKENYGKKKL